MSKGIRWPAILLLASLWWYILPGGPTAVAPAAASANPNTLASAGYTAVDRVAVEVMATAVNGLRRRHNLPLYQRHSTLDRLAQSQAERMAALQSVTHLGADNSSAAERATAAGYPERATEIIYGGPGDHEKAVHWWLNSSLHKSLILSDRYFEFGVGRAVGANDFTYWAIVMGAGASAAAAVSGPPVEIGPPAGSSQLTIPPVPGSVQGDLQRSPHARLQAPLPSSPSAPRAKTVQPAATHRESYLAGQNSTLPFDPGDAALLPAQAATSDTAPKAALGTGIEGGLVALVLLLATAFYVRRSHLGLARPGLRRYARSRRFQSLF
jgi:uncharacterized protein YkwD